MEKLGLNELREKYLSFFETKGHLRLPSFPLIPQNDNSLLLINAGMAPLKPYFTGKEIPPRSRVTTCQKCIRTPDIERVGKTARHGTFFEMLGNFSFGDYFKHEATSWAWEFITKVLEIPVDKLWITVYEDDDEAIEIWANEVGVDRNRIVKMGKEDNFWEIGTGPCGPCSEIYFDRGAEHGCGKPDCKVGCECDRYVEFWNLVFTQFDKDENGVYNRLSHPNIDTGMGLERLAVIMQDVNNLFEVDTIRNVMLKISETANVKYGADEKSDVSLRVITDHIRSTTFLVCDGVGPSNEGRGYVLRRLLRRAARHGKLLGINKPFLSDIADTVIDESKGAYPELAEKRDYIKRVIEIEEKRFNETIDSGLVILDTFISELEKSGKSVLDGENAFKLYDTYGFPIDLTCEILSEKGFKADVDGFNACMLEQKERARNGRKVGEEAGWSEDIFTKLDKSIKTEFLGYDSKECSGKVCAIIKDNNIVDSVSDGNDAIIILDKTVIYGESGGQVGDTGSLFAPGVKIEVENAKKLGDGKILHYAHISEGTVSLGDTLNSKYDETRRLAIMRNHSSTHLLQKALTEVLGSHIAQAGSMVDERRLRFDFSHFEAVSEEQLKEVEKKVNDAILSAYPINIKVMPIEEAKKTGAKALFGEKYSDMVRVVNMGDYSIEFCGGTHLSNTAQAGLFKILSESGVAAGVRRIEATTGIGVLEYIKKNDDILHDVSQELKTSVSEVVSKAKSISLELKESQKEIEALQSKLASSSASDLLKNAVDINGVSFISSKLNLSSDALRSLSDSLRDKMETGVAILASEQNGSVSFACCATKSAVERGIHCGNIVRETAKVTGGGGGGRPDGAFAGGKIPEKIDEALSVAKDLITSMIK